MTGTDLKGLFRSFRQETHAVGGRSFFKSWYAWAIPSRHEPIKKVARILKTRLDRILSWLASTIGTEVTEGFNSGIQSIKSAARRPLSFNTTQFGLRFTAASSV